MVTAIDASISRRRTPAAFLIPLALAFVLLGASQAFAISRTTILERAQRRIDRPVPYSQSKYYAGYRTDCSGYVSMCWATGSSYNTRTFYKVTHRIAVGDLRPGDALLKKGYHIRLFYGWLDDAHTQYISYESAYGKIAGCRIHSIAEDLGYGYVPVRYDRITYGPTSGNVLKNASFDTWARAWSSAAEKPAWWQTNADPWGPSIAVHRKSVYRSPLNSLQLKNPSADPGSFSELSQTAAVVPGAKYRLTGWATTANDPAGLELGLTYLDPNGNPIAQSLATGDACGANPTTFKMMSVVLTAPPEAVAARVTVRLAGGSIDTSSGPVAGASAILDDLSLARPQVSVSAKTSRTTARTGTTVTLSGVVTPKSAVGRPAVVYIKKPGASWTRLATVTVEPSGSAGAWKRKVTFKRSMPRGKYRFRTTVPAIPEYLGATSASVSVRLR